MQQHLTAGFLFVLLCLSAPAAGQQVVGAAKEAAQQVASAAKEVVQEHLPGAASQAKAAAKPSASVPVKGASGAELDDQLDEAIDAQEYKEMPDREVVAQVVPQEAAAKLANSDGDVATTGDHMQEACWHGQTFQTHDLHQTCARSLTCPEAMQAASMCVLKWFEKKRITLSSMLLCNRTSTGAMRIGVMTLI